MTFPTLGRMQTLTARELNRTTSDEFDFFGVEVSAVRIGDSDPAPRFEVVAKPNNWSREVRETLKSGELSGRAQLYHAYWSSFAEYLKANDPSFRIGKINQSRARDFRIGRSGFVITATVSTQKQRVGMALRTYDDPLKVAFQQLYAQRESIESEVGEALDWQEQPAQQASSIALYRADIDPADQSKFPEIHTWMLSQMQRFRTAFASRVKALDLTRSEPAED